MNKKRIIFFIEYFFISTIKATQISCSGFRYLLQERAFVNELVHCFCFIVTDLFIASYLECAIMFVLFCVIFALEALNTAIEKLCDMIQPEYDLRCKRIKDLGSVAVGFFIIIVFCYQVYLIANWINA